MERIHEKKVFSSGYLQLSANEIRMILQKFPEHKFSKVEILENAEKSTKDCAVNFERLEMSMEILKKFMEKEAEVPMLCSLFGMIQLINS
ncbi:hypothetical protein QYF36_003879 [Acer negundo]|nr:hypothetical protein QYF36_003879 [Acer negundo]